MEKTPFWIWPIRVSLPFRGTLLKISQELARLFPTPFTNIVAGFLWGLLPLPFVFMIGWKGLALVQALGLTLLLLAAVSNNSFQNALLGIATLLIIHSLATILLVHFTNTMGSSYPEGQLYWEKSRHWIVTGENPEYEASYWVGYHLIFIGIVAATCYPTLGMVPFYHGILQLDLMNCYVGNLMIHSKSPLTALCLGWHPWSLLRGIGFLFLIFFVARLSYQRATWQPEPNGRGSWIFCRIGILFLFLDGMVKYLWMEPTRILLAENFILEG